MPVAAALALLAEGGRVLLVRRANPPDRGLWGFPGGRVEPGETLFAAAERELLEETNVAGRAAGLVEAIDVIDRAPDGALRHHFLLLAVRCTLSSGTVMAGDDALEAEWFEAGALCDDDPGFSRHVARLARLAVDAQTI